jgi:4-hydroxybenzoate polyprenyltransferase
MSAPAPLSLSTRSDLPICVDLDGTLLRTDSLYELLFAFVRSAPWRLPLLFAWLFRGRAYLKRRLSEERSLTVGTLPYREDLVNFLSAESERGRQIVLVTGADETLARRVAAHLTIFSGVIGTNGNVNLTGAAKLAAIRRYLNNRPFVYAGDSHVDFHVWKGSEAAIVVNRSSSYLRALRRQGIPIERIFADSRPILRTVLSALRVHQWSKNTLILLPIGLAHRAIEAGVWFHGAVAFLSFSLAASALYVFNDLLDLEADRAHPRKRNRPFASGTLSIRFGIALLVGLLTGAAALSLWLPRPARLLLAAYCLSSAVYSTSLKRQVGLDVVLLALFYTVRILIGGSATGIQISVWTLAFSIFLFVSLALLKRITELRVVLAQNASAIANRGYVVQDASQISAFGAASSYLAVLVFALYINSPEVRELYKSPAFLWLICPLLIYWLSRVWILANRGQVHDDPIVFAFSDTASLITGAVALLLVFAAI